MSNEEQSKNLILEQGFNQFAKNGIRSFTVELLASQLSMSKKTIYKYFPNKEILVENIIDYFADSIKRKFKSVVESDKNPMDKFNTMMEFLIGKIGYLNMENAMEVKVRYPHIWKKIEKFRLEMIKYITKIFEEAQDQGYAKSDLDMDVVATIYMNILNSIFQPEFFIKNNLAPVDTIQTFVKMITEGIFLKPVDVKQNKNKFTWE